MPNELPSTELYLNQDMSEPQSVSVGNGLACVYSSRCPGKETSNEDSAALVVIDNQMAVLVVADGLGGVAAGERASNIAVRAMASAVRDAIEDQMLLRSAILNGFELANEMIQELGLGSATTMAVVEFNNGHVRPYHVGDSMIAVFGGRGKTKLQTISHSPVGYGVEAGLLDEAEAIHHEDRHLVSNVIGTSEMRIEIGPTIQLASRDTVLLASDGLTDNLHFDEIVQRLRSGPLRQATQQLVSDTHLRMQHEGDGRPSKPDDLTVVAFRPKAPSGAVVKRLIPRLPPGNVLH